MNFGAILRGALKGGAAMRAGQLEGRNEATRTGLTYDLQAQDRELRQRALEREMQNDQVKHDADAVRLELERRRTAAAETTAKATATRAAQGPRAAGDAQWKQTAQRAADYRNQGLPSHIASIKARLDVGASVNDGELEAYQRWERQQKPPATPPASAVPLPANRTPARKSYPASRGNITLP